MKPWLMLLLFFWLTAGAWAHGWYPKNCCSDDDCKPVPCDELREGDHGVWRYQDKEFQPAQVQPSQDRHCHVCIGKHGVPYCAFILFGT